MDCNTSACVVFDKMRGQDCFGASRVPDGVVDLLKWKFDEMGLVMLHIAYRLNCNLLFNLDLSITVEKRPCREYQVKPLGLECEEECSCLGLIPSTYDLISCFCACHIVVFEELILICTPDVARRCFVPVLLGHAIDDDFIHPHHSDHIFDAYNGDKNIIKFDGDHNSPRPQFYFDSITIFFHNVLAPPSSISDERYFHRMHDFIGPANLDRIHEHQNQNAAEPAQELAPSSTEDAIAQLRSRRPMSRTEVPRDISSQQNDNEDQEHGLTSNVGPSSTLPHDNMANGDSYGWLTPTSQGNEYLEYSFDSFSDMPCSIEDEERMIMEAMIESLKDMEMRHQQDDHFSVDTGTSKSACDTESSTVELNGADDSTEKSISSSTSCSNMNPQPNQESQEIEASLKKSVSPEFSADSSEVSQTNSVQDPNADGTRATLVVQKSSTSHIMEGLTRRWGLNFFKGNQ
ncbi:hypothetical protein ZIOFF_075752 [Zingiber officinale]|uniref:Uncharacterized protein n=2 Tax=Zingiber officinale TaxID=94328 RepID=A0A8J5BSV5_ZINOF|nr:hypothetical protein ZIOFF_075752 [Zingiber officinale]